MNAVVRAERAKATWLTGAAGLLILGTAFAMMLAAAPVQAHPRAQGAVVRTVAYVTTDVCHQLTSRSDSAAVRACLTGPSLVFHV